MGFWAEIKHAINSTIGTNKFKPLNEIIHDLYWEGRELVVSDELYKRLWSGTQAFPVSSSNQQADMSIIKFTTDGSISIRGTFNNNKAYLKISINDVVKFSTSSDGDFSADITYKSGDVLRLYSRYDTNASGSQSCSVTDPGIYARSVDSRFFNLMEVDT